MNRRTSTTLLSAVAIVTGAFIAPAQAAIITYNNIGATGLWNDPNNWDLVRVPEAGDDVVLGGQTLSVTAPSTFGEFHTTGGGGTVNVDNGGILTGLEDYSLRYATINVNDGGVFNAPNGFNTRTFINVNAGGTMIGSRNIGVQDARTVSVAGTFEPRGTTQTSGLPFQIGANTTDGILDVKATGKIILDIYANGINEYFNVGGTDAASKLKFADGAAIELRPQDGYIPAPGDAFDLLTVADGSLAELVLSGVTSNITISGVPGTLDTSAWESTGVVTVVPEPASIALFGLGAAFMLRRRSTRN